MRVVTGGADWVGSRKRPSSSPAANESTTACATNGAGPPNCRIRPSPEPLGVRETLEKRKQEREVPTNPLNIRDRGTTRPYTQ